MTRFEYINALRQALEGLPADVIAATVGEYERRIHEESAAGKSEEDIIASLGDPQAVAAERRANVQLKAFKQNRTATNFFRVCFSLIGLMIFNLFLIIPTIVYSALVFAAYCASLACYIGGIAVVTISLAGVGEVASNTSSPDTPPSHVQIAVRDKDSNVKLEIAKDGTVTNTAVASIPAAVPASASATTTASAASTTAHAHSTEGATVSVGPNDVRISDGSNKIHISSDDDDDDMAFDNDDQGFHIDMPGVHIYNPGHSGHLQFLEADAFHASRPMQFFIGIGMILGGIIAFLLCLAISRYSIIGILRLVQMEFAVLKSA